MLVATVVGHKLQDHVRDNMKLVTAPILDSQSFKSLAEDLADS